MYKNKVLLSCPDIPLQKGEWNFIENTKNGSKIPAENMQSELKSVTRLTLPDIQKLPVKNSQSRYLFYVKLTDNNVNSIIRRNGQRLEFYSLNELEKLSLSQQATLLFSEFKDEMQQLLSD